MSLKALLFPRHSRNFPGKRWLNISLRTLHLIGMAGLGGAYLYAAPRELWEPYMWLSLGSGFALVALFLYSNGVWLLQLRGLLILFKLVLLGIMLWLPAINLQLGMVVIVLSSVVSHAPGNVRYYSIWHGRRIEHL